MFCACKEDVVRKKHEPETFAWWQQTIAYEIYPSSFQDSNGDGIGDLKGIMKRLDHLQNLGVGALWLTPVYASPMVDNGYDVSNFYEINPLYGTMADMDSLIAEARKRGIKIVMDLVFNHTSDQCEWFLESKGSRGNTKADWYIWRDAVIDENGNRNPPNNWRGIFGGSAWEWVESRGQYYLHTFAVQQPDLNWENADVRKALYDIANFWIEKGAGGFRIDAIPYIKKPASFASGKPDANDGMVSIHKMTVNTDGILDFLQEFKKNVTEGKDVFTVAEANGVGPDDLKYWVGENGAFDMLFEFSHIHDVELWCKPGPFGIMDLKRALMASQKATAKNGWYPIFFENHDKPRAVNNFFSEEVAMDPELSRLASKAIATLMMTLRGTPFLYQGQEIGMTNVTWDSIDKYDEVNTKAQYKFAIAEGHTPQEAMQFVNRFSRDNARTPMQWDSTANAGFTTGKPWLGVNDNYISINVARELQDSSSVYGWYRTLMGCKRTWAFMAGAFNALLPEHEQIFAFERAASNGARAVVLVNLSAEAATYDTALLRGMADVRSSYGEGVVYGVLRPLESQVFEALEEHSPLIGGNL